MKRLNTLSPKNVKSAFSFFINVDFFSQYLSSLLNGIVTFLSISMLSHILYDSNQFSQISNILALFTVYQCLIDCGTNSEYIREASHLPYDALLLKTKQLAKLRLILALIIIPVAIIHGNLSNFEMDIIISLVSFAAAFIPLSILSVIDSFFLVVGKARYSIMLRLVRVLSLIVFVAFVYYNNTLNVRNYFLFYLFSVSCLSIIVILITKYFIFYKFNNNTIAVKSSKFLSHKVSGFNDFFINSWKLGFSAILYALVSIMFSSFLFKKVGLTNLSDYVAAVSLSSPIVVAMQSVNLLSMQKLAKIAHFSSNISKKEVTKSIFKISVLVLLVTLCGIFIVNLINYIGFFQFIIQNITNEFIYFLTFVLFNQFIVNVHAPILNYLQYKRQYFSISVAIVIACAVSLPIGYLLTQFYGVYGNLSGILFFWLLSLGISIWQFYSLKKV
ncbi:MAG: hypothetical protein K2X39_07465 [Silvanigrellaceae bacterium]|nr:hypothetical protein [Silvanigrellaceae bacterium]